MKIGVFDTGKGGELVANRLQSYLPEHTYTVVSDPEHAPYGERSPAEIRELTRLAIAPLIDDCPVIVLACNTATVSAIDDLRFSYPNTFFIGFEPMIKVAAKQSKNRHITLLSTTATARSNRTRNLIEDYAPDMQIDTPDTIGWASLIDHGKSDDVDLSEVELSINSGSDTIIIACTHYIALEPRLRTLCKTVLEPTEAVARQISAVIDSGQLR